MQTALRFPHRCCNGHTASEVAAVTVTHAPPMHLGGRGPIMQLGLPQAPGRVYEELFRKIKEVDILKLKQSEDLERYIKLDQYLQEEVSK
eukprot:gene2039-18216_t